MSEDKGRFVLTRSPKQDSVEKFIKKEVIGDILRYADIKEYIFCDEESVL